SLADNLPDTAVGHLFAHLAAFYSHNDEEAAKLLEVSLAHSANFTISGKESLIVNAAIFHSLRSRRLDLAEQWFRQLPAKCQTPGLAEQAEAAILEGRSDIPSALAKLEDSARATSKLPPGFQRDIALRLLQRWKQELTQHRASAAQ
ncbi:MAG: hypothetical protein ACRD4F_05410, partial [Candidatus Angelobacter sp.]